MDKTHDLRKNPTAYEWGTLTSAVGHSSNSVTVVAFTAFMSWGASYERMQHEIDRQVDRTDPDRCPTCELSEDTAHIAELVRLVTVAASRTLH